jgi:hypothetical protein
MLSCELIDIVDRSKKSRQPSLSWAGSISLNSHSPLEQVLVIVPTSGSFNFVYPSHGVKTEWHAWETHGVLLPSEHGSWRCETFCDCRSLRFYSYKLPFIRTCWERN